jgi:hypothetical protein
MSYKEQQCYTSLFADEEIEMQRGRDLPVVKEQVSGRSEIRLLSLRFSSIVHH